MPTTTANLALTLPTPNVDTGWGSTLNTDFTLIDNLFAAAGTGTSVGLNVGSGKTLGISGTLLLGSGDGTGTTAAPTIRGAARTGTNVVGANLVIDAPNGTGTGGSGAFVFRTAAPGSSGTTANTMQSSLVIDSSGNVGIGTTTMTGKVNYSGAFNSGNAGSYPSLLGSGSYGGGIGFIDTAVSGIYTQSSGSELRFFTGQTGADTAASKVKLSITGNGGVSFGSSGTAYGTSGQVLKSNGNATPTWGNPEIGAIGAQTFAAGGNSFFGIPAWAKSIIMTVGYMDKSSSTTDVLVRIGTSAGFVAASYTSSGSAITGAGANTINNSTGFVINIGNSIGSGTIRLNRVDGNSWVCDHTIGTTLTKSCVGGGLISLPGVLDRIQIIPITGTFAINGAVNVFYQ